ncbi:MAG: proton-conducting transporter membrane subunit [Anaerolineales bacterium]
MSSALLWILVPLALGVALLFYSRQDAFPGLLASLTCLFLSLAAWQLPLDVVMQLGPFTVEIAPSFIMLGRSFTLGEAQTPLLAFIYLLEAFWLLGAFFAKPGRLFVPISLICVGLLVASLAVEPFLYAALLIAVAAMLIIPLMVPPGSRPGPGVQRFLKYQIFAVPFILFTGWILSGVEASPGNLDLVLRAGLLLALGFTFLLALFPFHSWVPLLAKECHPYVFGFLVFFLPSIALIFGLGFFDRYAWLRDGNFAYPLVVWAGALATLLAGLWVAAERHPVRMFAFAAMANIGFGLQAVGLGGVQSAQVFFALWLPQALAMWVWATALGAIGSDQLPGRVSDSPSIPSTHPGLAASLLLAAFSLAGLPALGGFPGRLALLDGIAAVSPLAAVATLAGSLGLLIGALRMLVQLMPREQGGRQKWTEEAEVDKPPSHRIQMTGLYAWVLLAISAVGLVGFGVLPQLFLSSVPGMAAMFTQLLP